MMNAELSMKGRMNQMSSALREKLLNEIKDFEKSAGRGKIYVEYPLSAKFTQKMVVSQNVVVTFCILYAIIYVKMDALDVEAQLSPNVEVCDNIDLEIMLMEYESYYRMRFNKYPMLCKKSTRDVNATKNNSKNKVANTSKKNEPMKEKIVQQTSNNEATSDINLAVTVTSIFSNENVGGTSPIEPYYLKRERQSNISKSIEKLCSGDLEIRKIAEDVSREIVLSNLNVHWKDVIGLEDCKSAIREAIVYPLKYPAFFGGQFHPWKGILLYGAPGTGKTMLAKAVATECDCTFFNITASSLVSKWRGDSEKYIRVLFDLAYSQSPTIIFIDEIDWITTKIEDNSLSEPAKRFRSELLGRLDGLVSTENSNVVLLAATNAPWNIDAALLRRLERRIHVSLPDAETRLDMFKLYVNPTILEDPDLRKSILKYSLHFSGADIKMVCKQTWMSELKPIWMQFEKEKLCTTKLKYEITNYDFLLEHLQSTRPATNFDCAEMYETWY